MDAFFEKDLITTKHAGELSGYTPDYLARLARSGELKGKQVGRTWFINRESLQSFIEKQSEHKEQIFSARSRFHAEEYKAHNSIVRKAAKIFAKAAPASPVRSIEFADIPVRSPLYAIGAAVLVVAFGAFAEAAIVPALARSALHIAAASANGFESAFGIAESFRDHLAQAEAHIASVQRRVHEESLVAADKLAPQIITLDAPYIPKPITANWNLAFNADTRHALPTTASSIAPLAMSAYEFAADPAEIPAKLFGAYVSLGQSAYAAIGASFSAYGSFVQSAGKSALSAGAAARDALSQSPHLVSKFNLAFGNAIIGASRLAISADTSAAYGLAAAAPASARATVAALGTAGDMILRGTAATPRLAQGAFLRIAAIPASAAPAIASAVFGAEYKAALAFNSATASFSSSATRLAVDTVTSGVSLGYEAVPVLASAGNLPSAIQSAYLGTLSKGALAVSSFKDNHTADLAAVVSATGTSLTLGEQAALATYETIQSLIGSTADALAYLIGPPTTVVMPSVQKHQAVAVSSPEPTTTATSTQPAVSSQQPAAKTPTITYSTPTYNTTYVTGVSQAYVDQSLASLKSNLLATISSLTAPIAASTVTNQTTIQQVNMIQSLTGLTIHNGTFYDSLFQGGNISGAVSVNANSAGFGTLSAGTTNLGTTTVTGINVVTGSITSYTSASAPYFTATSTTATSTFSGALTVANNAGIGTTSPYAKLSIQANTGDTNTALLAVASSTANGTELPFVVKATGVSGFGFADQFDQQYRVHIVASTTGGIGSALRLGVNQGASPTAFNRIVGFTTENYGFQYASINVSSNTFDISSGNGMNLRLGSNADTIFEDAAKGTESMRIVGGNIPTSGNVGIGTTSPYSLLSISNNASTAANTPLFTIASTTGGTSTSTLLTVLSNSTVGINTSAPTTTLDVNGLVNARSSNGQAGFSGFTWGYENGGAPLLSFGWPGTTTNTNFIKSSSGDNHSIEIGAASTGSGSIYFNTNGSIQAALLPDGTFYVGTSTTHFKILGGNGNVGIGTSTPVQTLSVAGNGYLTGGLGVGVATTTPGAIQTTGDVGIGGNLFVNGNSTVIGQSTTNTLVINSAVASNIIPSQNVTYDLGSPSFYWRNIYAGTVTANNLSAASTSIAGTNSKTFSLDSNNATADLDNQSLIFFRGTVVPNATLTWNAAGNMKRFEFNQASYFNNASASTTEPTFTIQSTAGQTADIFDVASSSGTNLFNIGPSGKVGIGTTTPVKNLEITDSNVSPSAIRLSAAGNAAYYTDLINQVSAATGTILSTQSTNILTAGLNTGTQLNFTNGTMQFNFRNLPLATLLSGGNFGIGTTTPAYGLDVYSIANAYAGSFTNANGGGAANGLLVNLASGNTTSYAFRVQTQNGAVSAFQVMGDGSVGVATSAPSSRFSVNGNSYFAGTVGIGTASPIANLEVSGTTANNTYLTIGRRSGAASFGDYAALDFRGTDASGGVLNTTGRISSILEGSNDSFGLAFSTMKSGALLTEIMRLNSAGNVGIGSTSPWGQLSVNPNGVPGPAFVVGSSTATNFIVTNSGNVGIGTAAPSTLLDVVKAPSGVSPFPGTGVSIEGTSATYLSLLTANNAEEGIFFGNTISNIDGGIIYNNLGTTRSLQFRTGGNVIQATITSGGNFGIGTTAPSQLLTVGNNNQFTVSNTGNVVVGGTLTLNGSNGSGQITSLGLNIAAQHGTFSVLPTDGGTFDNLNITHNNGSSLQFTIGSNGLVGVGSSTPWAELSVNPNGVSGPAFVVGSSTATSFVVANSGNVGIGTTNPGNKLAIGSLATADPTAQASIKVPSGQKGLTIEINNGNTGLTIVPLTNPSIQTLTLSESAVGFGQFSWGSNYNYDSNHFGFNVNTLANGALTYNNIVGGLGTLMFIERDSGSIGSRGSVQAENGFIAGGESVGGTPPTDGFIRAGNSVGGATDIAGANLYLSGGISTGAASGGSIILRTSAAGVSGIAQNPITERMRITSTGNIGVASSSPWGLLSVNPNGVSGPALVVGSSTATSLAVMNGGGTILGGTAFYNASDRLDINAETNNSTPLRLIDTNGTALVNFNDTLGRATIQMLSGGSETIHFDTGGNSYFNGGNLGVGLSNPTYGFEVQGATLAFHNDSAGTHPGIVINNTAPNTSITLARSASTNGARVTFSTIGTGTWGAPQTNDFAVGSGNGNMGVYLGSNNTPFLAWDTNGNVGIGTTTPGAALNVYSGSGTPWNTYPAGTWAAIVNQSQNISGGNGLVVVNKFLSSASTIFEAGTINDSNGTYSSAFKITGDSVVRVPLTLELGNAAGSNTVLQLGANTSGAGGAVIANMYNAAGNPGVTVGTVRTDGTAFTVAKGITGDSNNVPNSGGTALLTVLGTGNVGIGTTSPMAKFSVGSLGGGTQYINIAATPSSLYSSYTSGGLFDMSDYFALHPHGMGIDNSGNFFIMRGGQAKPDLLLDVSGSVGIGTTTPQARTEISGTGVAERISSSLPQVDFYSTGSVYQATIGVSVGPTIVGTAPIGSLVLRGTPIVFGTADATERMRMDSNGNLGIGTTTPGTRLEVSTNGAVPLTVDDVSGTAVVRTLANFYGGANADNSGARLVFGTAAWTTNGGIGSVRYNGNFGIDIENNSLTSTAFFSNTGNVGIGTTSPAARLDVNGAVLMNGAQPSGVRQLSINSPSTVAAMSYQINGAEKWATYTDNNDFHFGLSQAGIGDRLSVTTAGNVGIGTTSPWSGLTVYDNPTTPSLTHGTAANASWAYPSGVDLSLFINNSVPFTTSFQTRNVNLDGSSYPLAFNPLGGNVGIGTSTPDTALDVYNTSFKQVVVAGGNGDAQKLYLGSVANSVGSYISNNAYYATSFNFTPNYTAASGMNFRQDGSIELFADTGLTTGVNYIPTKRLVVTNTGNVGIGTTSPSSLFSVSNGAGVHLRFPDSRYGNGVLSLQSFGSGDDAGVAFINTSTGGRTFRITSYGAGASPGFLAFRDDTVGQERMVIDSSGNVGIGTTTPASPLIVQGTTNWGVAEIVGGSVNGESSIGFRSPNIAKGATGDWVLGTNVSTIPTNAFSLYSGGNGTVLTALTNGNIGVGTTTMGATDKFTVAGTLAVREPALNTNIFQFYKPDGTNLLYGTWDGSNFHQYMGGNLHMNLEANALTFDGNNNNGSFVNISNNAYLALNSQTTGAPGNANIWGGPNSYASAGTPLTTMTPLAMATWAWNGSNGFSIESLGYITQKQNSTTNGDARLSIANGSNTELLTVAYQSGNVGIGTTSPYSMLAVAGQVVGQNFVATSTTATSTFSGGLSANNGGLVSDFSSGVTSISNLQMGAVSFDSDAGAVTWADMPITSASAAGVVNSYTAQINGNPMLSIYSLADGVGGTSFSGVAIGTSTPYARLTVWATSTAATSHAFEVANSASTTLLLVTDAGNVGIGTTSPVYKLDVNGIVNSTGLYVNGAPYIGSQWTTSGNNIYYNTGNVGIGTTSPLANLSVMAGGDYAAHAAGNVFAIGSTTAGTATSTLLVVNSSGSVGIGTTNPVAKLDIEGAQSGFGTNNGNARFLMNVDVNQNPSIELQSGASTFNHGFASYIDFAMTDSADFNSRIIRGKGVSGIANALLFLNDAPVYFSSTGDSNGTSSYLSINTNGNIGVGSTTPWGQLSVNPNGVSGPAFVVGSSTATNFVVTNSGNVGIGTTTPLTAKLNIVVADASDALVITNSGSGNKGWDFYPKGNDLRLFETNAGIGTGGSDRITFASGGNVGIGTTSPSAKLDVLGGRIRALDNGTNSLPTTGKGVEIAGVNNVGYLLSYNRDTSAYQALDLDGSTLILNGNSAGNVGVGTTSPAALLDVYKPSGVTSIDVTSNSATIGDAARLRLITPSHTYGFVTESASGTSVPSALGLYDYNNAAFRWVVNSSGFMGIGTTSPWTNLGVVGTVRVKETSDSTNAFTVENANATSTFAVSTVDTSDNIFSVASSTGQSFFEITNTGNVGIGTTSPETTLTVVGSICAARVPGTQTTACGTTPGAIYANSSSLSGGYDVAEMYNATDTSLTAGDVVAFDPNNPGGIARAASPASAFLGVISTNPGLTLGAQNAGTEAMALSGRVPVKVSADNGPIAAGDRLALSSTTPGVAVKATHSGQTIGVALASFTGPGTGTVDAFMSSQYWMSPTDFYTDPSTGRVGLGTTTPVHQLDVAGEVGAIGFVNMSTKTSKKDIVYDTADLTEKRFEELLKLKVATYHYNVESDSAPLRLGFIAEDAQQVAPEVLAENGKGVDLYKLATFTLSGVQALAGKVADDEVRIASLESRVAMLESGAVSTASGSPVTFSTTSLASALSSFGVLIEKGIAQFNTLVFRQLVASKDADGTSSAASVTILTGNTVVQVNNSLVVPTTKVFITFNSPVTGTWYVSDKTAGSFRVVLSQAQTADVSFDYFLVQTEGQIATSTPSQSTASSQQSAAAITVLGDNPLHLSVGSAFADPGVAVASGAPVTTYINGIQQPVSSTTISTASPTTYIITYQSTDTSGASVTATRSVIVGNPDGTVTTSGTTTSTTSTTSTSTATTTTQTAASSQQPTATTTAAAADTTPPVVTLNGAAAINLNVGDTWTDPGATATDNVDGDLTAKIVETGSVNTAVAASYTLTYSATDAAGNTGSASRVVTVLAPATTSTATTTATSTTP